MSAIRGWRCAVCATFVDIATPLVWRCPNGDDRHHLLQLEHLPVPLEAASDTNPFVAFGRHLAWQAFARANGMTDDRCDELTRVLDAQVGVVDGGGFAWTPFEREAVLSERLGFRRPGGVWVKDETGNVSGSHKARHLVSILLHLLAAEELGLAPWTPAGRPPLAIASCGNAALAAATLARAASWAIDVYVPPDAHPSVLDALDALGATITPCPRRAGDPPGDPCVHEFRRAVDAGAIPFVVQGPENAWCLDGGRTIGWELALQLHRVEPAAAVERLFVQVGGGALATCAARGVAEAGLTPRLHAVQTEGCAPLARAWEEAVTGPGGVAGAPSRWASCMWPWEHPPRSAATGILDDETYDWIGILQLTAAGGGAPVVVPERLVLEAHGLARATTSIPVDPTGSAGLAGLLALREQVRDDERVVVLFTGRQR